MARVQGHAAAAMEASMSAAEARARAKELGRRKYRLEGTPAGNSRFVYRETALRLQLRYGGKVVNYRPGKRPARRSKR